MGFKCPVCSKDFMKNRDAWNKHIELMHNSIGKDIVSLVHKLADKPKITKHKVCKKEVK